MLMHIIMASLTGGLIYSCLVALSFMLFLRRDLILTTVPSIQQRTEKLQSFQEKTERVNRMYRMWAWVWMPTFLVTVGSVGWMWDQLTNNAEVAPLAIGMVAVAAGGVLTTTFTKQFITKWIHMWDSQLQLFHNEVILSVVVERVSEINKIVAAIANGEDTELTIADIEIMVIEAVILHQTSNQIMEEQATRIAQLNAEVKELRNNNGLQRDD